MVGNVSDAAMLAINSMEVRRKVSGKEHEDTLWSIAMVGLVYRLAGRCNTAEELEVQVMKTRKTKLGVDHSDTLNSMSNVAFTWKEQDQLLRY